MIVSGIPTWIVAIIAVLITSIYYFRYRKTWMGHWLAVYYFRYRKTWMGHWLAVLLIFALHFFFFAWGIVIFLFTEWIRAKAYGKAKEKYKN
jgi:hypothetical protein